MNSRSLTLDEFIVEYPFWNEWKVSYTDGTHLEKKEYVKLGDITIDASEKIARAYPILPFTFRPVDGQDIKCDFSKLFREEEQANNAKKTNKKSSRQEVLEPVLKRKRLFKS